MRLRQMGRVAVATLGLCFFLVGCGQSKENQDKTQNSLISETEESHLSEESLKQSTEDKEGTESINDNNRDEGAENMSTQLTYLGQATIKIVTPEGKVIYIDPSCFGDFCTIVVHFSSSHANRDTVFIYGEVIFVLCFNTPFLI